MKRFFTSEFWAERDMELFIGKLLRYGVIISCIITLIGGIFYLLQQGTQMPDYSPIPDGKPFPGVIADLRELYTIIPLAFNLNGAAIIQFGVCVLIATPILRVAFSIIAFLAEKDYLYVGITMLVLAIIIANMLLGLH